MKILKKYFSNITITLLAMSSLLVSIAANAQGAIKCQADESVKTITFKYPTAAEINTKIAQSGRFIKYSDWPTCDSANFANCRAATQEASPYVCSTVSLTLPTSIETGNKESYNDYALSPKINLQYTLDEKLTLSFNPASEFGGFFSEPASTKAPIFNSSGYTLTAIKTFTKPNYPGPSASCPTAATPYSYSSVANIPNLCSNLGYSDIITPVCTGSGNTYTCSFCCADS